jgi:TolB-like protein/class 3 adenylate cyclase/tetratricopeptide (TPR) repeat protein
VEGFLLAREQRRLAAIVAADVVGYSRLMGRDESGTLACLREHRKRRLEPTLARHGGRLVKLTGDGALVEFPSAVDALCAAIEFQQAMEEANRDQPEDTRIVFRIGLHLGDLIVDGDDLYGDSVNVAARLEAEAPPGGIVISGNAHDAVVGRLKAAFEDMGDLSLKNIERPVRAYCVRAEGVAATYPTVTPSTSADAPLALPDKPSIAVLPFQNMSGDPEQEYFTDGMVEDIISALSRNRGLFVIARNSSFTYKGRAVDIKQVGRELGVRYVLEGSVRKAANRVRITGQLIDASSGSHVWADRFDGTPDDIFDLQDQVTSRVVTALGPILEQAEIERSRRKPTGSLKAYDFYLRGRMCYLRQTKEGCLEAFEYYAKALEIDPEFARAYAATALGFTALKANYWSIDPSLESAPAETYARRALALDKTDSLVLASSGWSLALVAGQIEEAGRLLDLAIELDPNLFAAWSCRGWIGVMLGETNAFEYFEQALRRNPLDRYVFGVEAGIAHGHFLAGHLDTAISWATRSLQRMPGSMPALNALIVSKAMAGQIDEAKRLWAERPEGLRNIRIATLRQWFPAKPEVLERYAVGFRLAGVPE